MFGIGAPELIVILIIGLIVFGPGKLPELGRSLGSAIREFRSVTDKVMSDVNITDDKPANKAKTANASKTASDTKPAAEAKPAEAAKQEA